MTSVQENNAPILPDSEGEAETRDWTFQTAFAVPLTCPAEWDEERVLIELDKYMGWTYDANGIVIEDPALVVHDCISFEVFED